MGAAGWSTTGLAWALGLFGTPVATHSHLDLSRLSGLEWALIGVAGLAALWSIWRAVQFTLHPGETETTHIKRSILAEPPVLDVRAGVWAPQQDRAPTGHGGSHD